MPIDQRPGSIIRFSEPMSVGDVLFQFKNSARGITKADITGVSSNAVDVRFRVDDGEMKYRLHTASNTNPFTQNLLAGYRIPRSLY